MPDRKAPAITAVIRVPVGASFLLNIVGGVGFVQYGDVDGINVGRSREQLTTSEYAQRAPMSERSCFHENIVRRPAVEHVSRGTTPQ